MGGVINFHNKYFLLIVDSFLADIQRAFFAILFHNMRRIKGVRIPILTDCNKGVLAVKEHIKNM